MKKIKLNKPSKHNKKRDNWFGLFDLRVAYSVNQKPYSLFGLNGLSKKNRKQQINPQASPTSHLYSKTIWEAEACPSTNFQRQPVIRYEAYLSFIVSLSVFMLI